MDSSNFIEVYKYYKLANDPKVIVYKLNISFGGQQWELEKRYSHFDQLNEKLKEVFGSKLPMLPKKTFKSFWGVKSEADSEERRNGLHQYIQELSQRQDVLNSDAMKQFIELEEHASQELVNPPQKGCVCMFLGGQICILLIGLMIVLLSEMSVALRVDAYLSNIKMPWCEQPTKLSEGVPVGAVELWKQNAEGIFMKQWTKSYTTQAICLHWNKQTSTLIVGCDSGQANLLKVSSDYEKFVESMEIELHYERIMGLYYDSSRSLMHSVSKDRRYRVLDIESTFLKNDCEPSGNELTGLIVCPKRMKSFISDRNGSVFIFDVTEVKPVPVIELKSELQFIKGMHLDTIKNYLLVVGMESGSILVYDIDTPGYENKSKEVTILQNSAYSRDVSWSRKRGEVYVGTQHGTVTIWDVKYAQPIYAWKTHNDCITRVIWLEDDQTLLTASKDKTIKAWKLPDQWKQPQQLIKNKSNHQQFIKQVQTDEHDDLVDWHK